MNFATYWNKESWPKVKGTMNCSESLTDQSFKSMCEIEQLLINSRATPRTPVYDMNNYETSSWSFEDWQNEKAKIERKFLHLDEKTREMFGTPQKFFEYCSNPDNYQIEDGKIYEKPQDVTTLPELPVEQPVVDDKTPKA